MLVWVGSLFYVVEVEVVVVDGLGVIWCYVYVVGDVE